MNSCILMVRIAEPPVRRMTPDGQSLLADMFIEFGGLRETDPPQRLRAVGWGRLAEEILQNYHVGDVVILQGSLRMNTFDRPEGFKEKRAELTIAKIYRQGSGMAVPATPAPPANYGRVDNVVPMQNYSQNYSQPAYSQPAYSQPAYSQQSYNQQDYSQPSSSQSYNHPPEPTTAPMPAPMPTPMPTTPVASPPPAPAPSTTSDDDLDEIPF